MKQALLSNLKMCLFLPENINTVKVLLSPFAKLTKDKS